jgi:5-(carboxyamino)imidazole ribonucleotide mutase
MYAKSERSESINNYMSEIKVAIIMGSDSDLPVMQQASDQLNEFGISNEVTIVSAHRTPERMYEYAKEAKDRGIKVIIAGAGGSAHLPGMVASLTTLPVIGVPVKTATMDGLDSLLSIVQMPGGIPVATVAVNGAKNAGLLAARILGTSNPEIAKQLGEYKQELNDIVMEKIAMLEKK